MAPMYAVVSRDGLSIFADGLAFDPDKGFLVAASFLGYPTSIKAIWAAFSSKLWVDVRLPSGSSRALLRDDNADYFQVASPRMPESGTQHVVLLHKQATKLAVVGEDFYVFTVPHIVDIEAQAERQFGARFGELTTIPVEPPWTSHLWKQGRKQRLITASSDSWAVSFGFTLWRIAVEREPWFKLIEKGLATGALQ